MINFHLDQRCGLPPYHQLVRQVRQALLVGQLNVGDRLPTVKELSTQLAINQNTVLKAYRELEYSGLIAAQPGVGTFIRVSLAGASLAAHDPLRQELQRWLSSARQAGLDDESIEALITTTLRTCGPGVGANDPTTSVGTVRSAGAR